MKAKKEAGGAKENTEDGPGDLLAAQDDEDVIF